LEGAIGVAEEDGDAFGGVEGEVRVAVAVEVCEGVRGTAGAGVVDALEGVGEVAVAGEDADAGGGGGVEVAASAVGDGGFGDEMAAVAGEAVQSLGAALARSGEGAVPVAVEDVEAAVCAFGDEVWDGVVVYVLEEEDLIPLTPASLSVGGYGEGGGPMTGSRPLRKTWAVPPGSPLTTRNPSSERELPKEYTDAGPAPSGRAPTEKFVVPSGFQPMQ
jgi:hypothetical protein